MRRLWWVGLAGMLSACATTPPMESLPQVQAWLAAGGPTPPPVEDCPHVAEVDLWDIAMAERAPRRVEERADFAARMAERFAEITIEDGFRRPPPDAPVILRALEPPGGMYSNTVWSVVWQEPDGSWWFWRQNRTNEPPPPPPPPPGPDATEAEQEAYRALFADGRWDPPDHVRWPPAYGPLGPHQVAALEAALADPCRAWEPDLWPWDPPIRGRPARVEDALLPQDWTPIYVQIEEMGRPPRSIARPNDHPSHVGTLTRIAYSPFS